MTSENRIVGYLVKEDYELFKTAKKRYDMKESQLVKEIMHTWLFSNKLQLKK